MTHVLTLTGVVVRLIALGQAAPDLVCGSAAHPTATVDTDAVTLRSLAFGRLALADAVSDGRIVVGGDVSAVTRFLTLFGSR